MSFKEYVVELSVFMTRDVIYHTYIKVMANCEAQAEQVAYSTPWEKFKWVDKDNNVIKDIDTYYLSHYTDHEVKVIENNFNESLIQENNSYFNEYEALGYAIVNYERDFVRSKDDVR